MDNDTSIASITSASTIVSAFGAAYLTNYLNNKKQKDNEEDILINDIKNFAQQCFNIANDNKGSIKQHDFIRLTRTLKEYQSYFRVLNLNENEAPISKSLTELKRIVKTYREDYRKNLINSTKDLDQSDSNKQSSGFNYILKELAKINK